MTLRIFPIHFLLAPNAFLSALFWREETRIIVLAISWRLQATFMFYQTFQDKHLVFCKAQSRQTAKCALRMRTNSGANGD